MRLYTSILVFLLLLPVFVNGQDTTDDDFFFINDVGITVTGTIQTSQQMTVIEKEEIERSGSDDLANLLQERLGLNIVRLGPYGNQTGINLRGLDSRRIAFLIDGVPVNSSNDGRFDFNQIDLNSIERIEIIYGGSDTKYNVSGAIGGVINIITVRKNDPGLRLSLSVSNTSILPQRYTDSGGTNQSSHLIDLFDTQNYSLSAIYGTESFSFSSNVFFNRAENHFTYDDNTDIKRRKENNEVWDFGTALSLVWQLPDLSKFIISSNFYYSDKNIPNPWSLNGNPDNQLDFSIGQNFIFDKPRAFIDDLAAEISLSWNFLRRDYTPEPTSFDPDPDFSRIDQYNLTIINRWNWFTADYLTLRSGIDYRFVYLNSTTMDTRSRHDGGIYLTAELELAESFMLIPSVKIVYTSEGTGNTAIIPKLGLLWNVTDNFVIKNNYFRSFKFPDFQDLYWADDGWGSIGNPNLRPEDGWGADIGASWNITKSMQIETVFWLQWLKDSIQWFEYAPWSYRPENVEEAVFFGLDNKINLEIPISKGFIQKIIPSIYYNFLLSYMLDDGKTFSSDVRVPYSPLFTAGFSLNIIWETGSVLLSGHFESERFDTTPSNLLKPHFLFNASMNQKIGDNLVMFGALRNILNSSYQSRYNCPMPGITLTLGMRVNLEVGNE